MEIRYRRPVDVADRILVSARVDERRGRRLKLSGELSADDEVKVQASGLYLVSASVEELFSPEHLSGRD